MVVIFLKYEKIYKIIEYAKIKIFKLKIQKVKFDMQVCKIWLRIYNELLIEEVIKK